MMRFCLAQCLPVYSSRTNVQTKNTHNLNGECVTIYTEIKTEILPIQQTVDPAKLARMKQLLQEFMKSTPMMGQLHNAEHFIWSMDFVVGVSNTYTDDRRHLKGYLELCPLMKGSCFEGLSQLSDGEATIKIVFTPEGTSNQLITKEIAIPLTGCVTCTDDEVKFPVETFARWLKGNGVLRGRLSIVVTVPDEILTGIYGKNTKSGITDAISLNQHIQKNGTLSKITIVAKDGSTFKADKNYLAAQSTGFEKKFTSGQSNATDETIELPNMSEESVRALLKFFYFHNIADAEANSEIACQLLHAGHEFEINTLKFKMHELFMKQPCEWFKDVDVAVRLFLFARKMVPANEQLKLKAMQVLKLYSKDVERSPTYHETFKTDAAAAMELCKHALAS